jgi:hypothetical protein
LPILAFLAISQSALISGKVLPFRLRRFPGSPDRAALARLGWDSARCRRFRRFPHTGVPSKPGFGLLGWQDNLLSPQRFGFIKPLVVALEGNV